MNDLLSQLRAFHAGLEPARRRVLWAALALAVAAVVGVGVWASSPTYVTLTVARDGDELARVTRALSEGNVPYKLGADGLTVTVKQADELEARRTAAGDGGIVGLEGLEQIDPWVTPFQEQLHRKRMLQGELVRTIEGIAGVRAAVVNLDLPPPSAFLRDAAKPTASVTLTPDPGVTLDTRTARSIAELVAHAVSGMVSDDVRVVDTSSGRTLWAGAASDVATDTTSTAAAREAALASGVSAALAQILGRADAATVTVSVELETAAVQQTVNAVDPNSAVTASERIESETDTRGGTTAGGVPGTDSNVPERASNAATASGTRARESTQTTYQFTTTTTTTTTPAGSIKRLAAAVVIDQAVVAKVAAGADDATLKAQLEAAVKAALGASDERGDEVVVSFLPFYVPEEVAVTEPTSLLAEGPLANAAVAALALILVFVFLVRPLVNAARAGGAARVAEAAKAAEAAKPVTEDEGAAAATDNTIDLAGRLRTHLARISPHAPTDVSELVQKESENSAEVVRRWLKSS